MRNKISFQERLIRAFGREEDHEKYFDIFKDEFYKALFRFRDEIEELDIDDSIRGSIKFILITDETSLKRTVSSDCYTDDGNAYVRFSPDNTEYTYNYDKSSFKDKETYVRYLAYHECCHVVGMLLYDRSRDKENASHGKLFQDLMNMHRSEYTEVPFNSPDGVHSNFGEIITFGYSPLAFIGKTGKQVARECYEKFGDITTEEGWKRLKDYNDSLIKTNKAPI